MMKWISLVVLLVTCAGCSRYVPWIKQTFNQVPICHIVSEPTVNKYLRSTKVYYEFDTVGFFDALWFSPEMREFYDAAVEKRYGIIPCERPDELEFYFLMLAQDQQPQLSNDDPESIWAIRLQVDGVWYRPTSIKLVDLDPIMKDFFVSAYTRFRNSYRVVFAQLPAQVVQEDYKKPLRMEISSMKYCIDLFWNKPAPAEKDCGC